MTRTPHALVYSREYPPTVIGGTSTAARNLAVGLVAEGWRVTVVTTESTSTCDTHEVLDRVRVHRVGTGTTYQAETGLVDDTLRNHRRLLVAGETAVGDGDVDLLALPDLFCYPEAAVLARRHGIPLLNILLQDFRAITPYDRDSHHVTNGVSASHTHLVALEEKAFLGSDHTAFISQALSDAVTGYYPADGVAHSVVHLGIDQREIAEVAADPDWQAARARLLRAEPAAPLLVAVGRLVPVKGFAHLVEALALLDPAGPGGRAHLVLHGVGPEEDRLRRMVDDLGLTDRVTFFSGTPRRDALGWMSVADVGVVPSLWESFCYVCAEMMALGRPVVATAVDSLHELVLDDTVGYPVPVSGPSGARRLDPADLASRIDEALADPDEARRRGAAARDRMASVFTNERFATGISEIAHRLVAKHA
jgi:glycosyltransferase involved in cell wall biosynthesis